MRYTVATLFGAALLGMAMLGSVDAQSPGQQRPQTLLLQAQPSALPSPVLVNEYDSPRTDGEGNQWVRVRGTITTSSTGTTNVSLPAASPVPVRLEAVATSAGYAWYCAPQFGGGSSEVTVKSGEGLLLGGSCSTNSTSDVYLLLWDATDPTPGTTAPLASFCIPGGTGTNRAMYDFWLPAPGVKFSTALTVTTTTSANGSSTPSGNTTVNLMYK